MSIPELDPDRSPARARSDRSDRRPASAPTEAPLEEDGGGRAHAAGAHMVSTRGLDRRAFVGALAAMGVGSGLFPGVLWARAQDLGEITPDVVAEAEKLAGLSFTPGERELMLERLRACRDSYAALREVSIPRDVPPAVVFDPTPHEGAPAGATTVRPSAPGSIPDAGSPVDVAYASIGQLGALLREGSIRSVELTELYLDRLRRLGPRLRCVVTLTERLAFEQAERADRELAAGRDRGPLHGIPWGAKDILAVRGYPTTWGAPAFRTRRLDGDATVVSRLEEAGAVLVAKLSLGELAMGDEWFGGRTRNPWALEQGSSGSSAGSAAATAAGLVPFAIGSETLGSIVSPAARCGATALRPTFGRVSRHGAMPLAWSMDKIGPICRSAEDCALVLAAIQGPDGLDPSVQSASFEWDGDADVEGIRVGFLREAFEAEPVVRRTDPGPIESLSAMGVELVPVELPRGLPLEALRLILEAEAAAAFDELVRTDADDSLVGQDDDDWPNILRAARFVPAVEYLRASRIRTLLMVDLQEAWSDVDVVAAPSLYPDLLVATNLTGHPAVVVPHGTLSRGTPGSVSFLARPWSEEKALHVARMFQTETEDHLRRPPGFE